MIEIFQYDFFRYAVAGLLIISVASAIIGTYIVSRRLVALSGGITHACFGGLGLGYFIGFPPVAMAAVVAVGSAAAVEWLGRNHMREDSATAVVWALGMALGILFVFLTPGYVPELNTFLFGNVLTITSADLWVFGIFTFLLLLFVICLYSRIVACAFDRDFARVAGLHERLINYIMTVMIAVCIVLTIRLVGIMLLMSMLTIPQLTAEVLSRRLRTMMSLSAIISAIAAMTGLMLAVVIDVPCSALIVLVMTAIYAAVRLTAPLVRRLHARPRNKATSLIVKN